MKIPFPEVRLNLGSIKPLPLHSKSIAPHDTGHMRRLWDPPCVQGPLSHSKEQVRASTGPESPRKQGLLSSKPGYVPHGEAADHSTENWQASEPWICFPAPSCCHRCPDFITEMSLETCRNSWKWEAGASLIGSNTGHACVRRRRKKKRKGAVFRGCSHQQNN